MNCLIETGKVHHGNALDEALPFGGVLSFVQLSQRLLNLLRAAFQGQVIIGRRLQHPIGRLQFIVGGILERVFDVLLPRFTREGAGHRVTSSNQVAIIFPYQFHDCDWREAGRGTRLDLGINTFTCGHAFDDATQVLARLIQQADIQFQLWESRIRHLLNGKGHDALGTLNHLLTTHGAPIGLQPRTPEACQLITHVTRLQPGALTEHQVSLQGVVGLGHIRAGCFGVAAVGDRHRSNLSFRRRTGTGSRRRHGRRRRIRNPAHRLELCRLAIDLGQIAGHRLRCGLEHHGLQALEVLLFQARFNGVTLVEAQTQRPRTVFSVTLNLLQTILQDLQGLQPRLQVRSPFLHLFGLQQI